jgi:regulatory protein
MRPHRQPAPELDAPRLRALAMRYVGRYATTRGKLRAYLKRKIQERGWGEPQSPDLDLLVEEFSERGYVDDQSFALGKTASLKRKAMGAFRIKASLQAAGIDADMIAGVTQVDEEEAMSLALAFARRKHIGPFASSPPDEKMRNRWMSAFLRAGHRAGDAHAVLSLPSVPCRQE